MGSGLDDFALPQDAGAALQAGEGAGLEDPAGDSNTISGKSPQKTEEDWYREMQFHYDSSLQQGYSAAETEDWLRQGYLTLMDGFLSWYQVGLTAHVV